VPMAEEHVANTAKLFHAVVIGPIVDLVLCAPPNRVVRPQHRVLVHQPVEGGSGISWRGANLDGLSCVCPCRDQQRDFGRWGWGASARGVQNRKAHRERGRCGRRKFNSFRGRTVP
jgi:hypothetical protein